SRVGARQGDHLILQILSIMLQILLIPPEPTGGQCLEPNRKARAGHDSDDHCCTHRVLAGPIHGQARPGVLELEARKWVLMFAEKIRPVRRANICSLTGRLGVHSQIMSAKLRPRSRASAKIGNLMMATDLMLRIRLLWPMRSMQRSIRAAPR